MKNSSNRILPNRILRSLLLSLPIVFTAGICSAKDLKEVRASEVEKEGFPTADQEAILKVAAEADAVIMVRPPGEVCKQLLEQGYDGKSFHIKAKSCNWGPMAGFVCLDPRMNKSKEEGEEKNLEELNKSFKNRYEGKQTRAVQIAIDRERERWVREMLGKDRSEWKRREFKDTYDVVVYEHTLMGRNIVNFVLIKDRAVSGPDVYYMYYDYGLYNQRQKRGSALRADEIDRFFNGPVLKNETYFVADTDRVEKHLGYIRSHAQLKGGVAYKPLWGIMNPNRGYTRAEDHRNAVTGDYDLFAVWPKKASADDKRVGGMIPKTTDAEIADREKQHSIGSAMGNISYLIQDIGQKINSQIGKPVNRIFHSDESGRPFVDDVDSAIVFDPSGKMYKIADAEDLAVNILHYSAKKYTCYINKGWAKTLTQDVLSKVAWSEQIDP